MIYNRRGANCNRQLSMETNARSAPGGQTALFLLLAINLFNYIDRYVLASLGGKNEALVWVTAWDTGLDAAEFVDALDDAIPVRYRHAKRVTAAGDRRRYEGAGRIVEVTPVTVSGHSVVLFIDVPAGVAPDLVDAARIRITP